MDGKFLLQMGESQECAILLKDNMDWHMSRLGTVIPEGPWSSNYALAYSS